MTSQPSANLTTVQAQVVKAFAEGATTTAAATAAGIHRSTIYAWLQTQREFAAAVHQARADYRATLNDHRSELARTAFFTLRTVLEDPHTPPAVRCRLALLILDRYPLPGSELSGLAPDTFDTSDTRNAVRRVFQPSPSDISDTSDTSNTHDSHVIA